LPLRVSDFPAELDVEAPMMYEHNAEILRERLGYTAAQIEALTAQGILKRGEN